MFSYRKVYLYLFIICCCLIGFAAYLQYFEEIEPCLLCMLQRLIIFVLGLLFVAASLHQHNQASKKIYNTINLIFCCLGMLVAGRQLWLQHLPPNTQDVCMPGYQLLIETSSWSTLLKYAIVGTQDCAQINWSFLGISMAGWSFGVFVFFALVILFKQTKYS
jgi:disulfide bond formation protein DsbB